jgi:hypothetical protein
VSFRIRRLVTALCAAGLFHTQAAAQAPAPAAPLATFPQPAAWPLVTSASATRETLGPGVDFERWTLATSAGPLQLSIAIVDLRNPDVSLRVGTHDNAIVGAGERLTSMADRLGAEAGINADYFDINDTGAPLNVVMVDGRVLHQPDLAAALTVAPSGGPPLAMGPVTYALSLSAKNVQLSITHINEWSQSDDIAELTPEFGGTKAFGATEAVLAPTATPGIFSVTNVARDLAQPAGLNTGDIGIVAHGSGADSLAALAPGDAVTLTPVTQPPLANAAFAVGGGPMLLLDGQPVTDLAAPAPEETDVRNPVTAAGVSADGSRLWLVVVDGRAPARSIGLTRPQLGSLMAALGASTAMAFDSGGSSEMVVRHLGDLHTSVANAPSDGRERSVADGLFVVNAASPGAPTQLLLGPSRPIPAVLVNSHLQIQAQAIDANDQPVTLAPGAVVYSVDPAAAAIIGADGMLRALKAGPLTVHAAAGSIQGALALTVVPAIEDLNIAGPQIVLPAGGRKALDVVATTREGIPIVVDPGDVTWRVESGAGRVDAGGMFVAGNAVSRTLVSARAGGAVATATILVGEHAVMLQATMPVGPGPGEWSYGSRPAGLPGGVSAANAPDGSAALRLQYDFSTTNVTRAAYAQTSVVVRGQPSGLTIDVYGDGAGEWLRGGYQNADGNDESLTIARHVDWRGWRTIHAVIPPQAGWPITWTRFYAVEPDRASSERGSLWLRNFALIYPGPA